MEIDEEDISNESTNALTDRITSAVDTDFHNSYRKLPTKTAVTIRLFERNEYYTCHGDDAVFIARELLQSTNALKYWKTSGNRKNGKRQMIDCCLQIQINHWKRSIYQINSLKIFFENFY